MGRVTCQMIKKWLILGKSPIFRSQLESGNVGACKYRMIDGKIFYTLRDAIALHASQYTLPYMYENYILVLSPLEE